VIGALLACASAPAPSDYEAPGVESVGGYDPIAEMFSGEEVPHFDIELSSAALEALRRDPLEYTEGAITYRGRRYEPVGVRLKGQGSFLPIDEKAAFKIDFDAFEDGGRFHGIERLTFNNMRYDYSMLHERLGYAVYRELGVPASRAAHATLAINGALYGLYTNLESVDEDMAGRWFDDLSGSMFEAWDVDFYDRYIGDYELEFGPDDRSGLQGTADALEDSGEEALAAAAAHVDLDGFLAYWAAGVVIGQFDAYPYSWPGDDIHLYDDPEAGLTFIPWGVDETFSGRVRPDRVYGILGARCLDVGWCEDAWRRAVADALDVADAMDLAGLFDAVAEQIAPHVEADRQKPYSEDAVWREQRQVREFITGRRAELERELGL